jgi:murein DD-endopeptidase
LQLGAPYRFGGSDPATGFDCSGLVSFVHAGAGIRVPRTAAAQSAAAMAVPREQLESGDLVFFRSRAGEIDHVAIYAGDGELLHAPGRGRVVERIRLDDPWFRSRYAGAGRFWTAPAAPGR